MSPLRSERLCWGCGRIAVALEGRFVAHGDRVGSCPASLRSIRTPRALRAPRPKAPPKPAPTKEEKRRARLERAREMTKLWTRKLRIATGRLARWQGRLVSLERQAAVDAAVAKATAQLGERPKRKITLEG